jgi:hypothetical protein
MDTLYDRMYSPYIGNNEQTQCRVLRRLFAQTPDQTITKVSSVLTVPPHYYQHTNTKLFEALNKHCVPLRFAVQN